RQSTLGEMPVHDSMRIPGRRHHEVRRRAVLRQRRLPSQRIALAPHDDEVLLDPERQLALARAWLAADQDTVTQARHVTVLRPVISMAVPRHDVAVAE